ncbi:MULTISPECIES: hypothetical protein [unclassified Streptomyces]|uniref:hypothetical protein n=1 Tax=unclassified Streptomyces TaxID=2593676 RepID=UPI0037F3D61E
MEAGGRHGIQGTASRLPPRERIAGQRSERVGGSAGGGVGRLRTGIPDLAHAYGRELAVHYAPDDLTFFALDPADARSSARWDIAFVVLLIGAAAAAAGVVLL